MNYVMSDIHGNSRRFNSILEKINLKPDDTLFVLGDVIDRYPDGIRILRRLIGMPNVKMVLGNHEYMMLNALDRRENAADSFSHELRLWYHNGGDVTHKYIKHIRKTVRKEIFEYLRSLPLNIEIKINEKAFMLVHGGAIPLYKDYKYRYETVEEYAVWHRVSAHESDLEGTTIVFGHTPTMRYQHNNPLEIWTSKTGGKIGIDCGSGFPLTKASGHKPVYGRLACLCLDDMKVYYSDEEIPEEVEKIVW